MNLFAISGLFLGLTIFPLGIFVFLKKSRNRVNQLLAIFCFAGAIWGFGGFKVGIITNQLEAFFWWKITYVGIIFIPILFYHFVHSFLNLERIKILVSIYTIGIFFLALEWSQWDYLFFGLDNIGEFFSFYWITPPTILFLFFVFWWFTVIVYSHYKLYNAFKLSTGLKRVQIKYLFLAALFGFSGGGTCFLPCFGVNVYPVLNFVTPLYPAIIAYAIIRHRLMDIKLVLRKSSVYFVSLITIIISAVFVRYVFNLFFPASMVGADFIILISAISVFPPIKNYYYRLANKYFFSSLYDSREVIAGLSDKLRSTIEVSRLYRYITDTLINSFHARAVGVLTYDEKKEEYIVQYNKGFNIGTRRKFLDSKDLHEDFAKKNKSIVVEEIKSVAYKKYKKTINTLISLGVEIFVPLNIKNKTIGLIVLGPKESGDMYNDEDLQVLEIIGAQAAIAIENALIYEENRNFGIKLEKEVKKATAELRSANEKLKQLDAAKSEFISIASHQLRTPLTVIKGYISMMLEGNFGKLTPSEVESLEKVYESNERLIQLVENLLNVSRIESGRLQFNYEAMQLEDLVSDVIEELSNSVKKKGLRLNYKLSKEPLPTLKLDEEKVRQVVMNLIDNAIKYTRKGNITVNLKRVDKNIEFCVSDTGIGVSKEDLANLFRKFSRGSGTSLIHTEGTGLGLYVAWEMVEAHEGKIWAESKGEGKGSKFCFTLPIYAKK